MKQRVFIRKSTVAMGALMVGMAGIVIGFVLFYFLDPLLFYDLGLYVAAAGAALLVYGCCQICVRQNRDKEIEISFGTVKCFLADHVLMIVLLLTAAVMIAVQPRFLQIRVLLDILTQSSIKMIVALGVGITLLSGGIDLSAGRMFGLAAVISASMLQEADYAGRFFPDLPQMVLIVPLIAAVLSCAVFGALNGLLTAKYEMHPLIATLAVQVMIYGVSSLYFGMAPNHSQPIGGVRSDFAVLGQHKLFTAGGFPGISILVPIAALFIFLVWLLLNKTAFGRNVRLVGANRAEAAASGVSVFGTVMCSFILAAVLYGAAGILEAARTSGATNNYGSGYELDAAAACAAGGVSLNGGRGNISGIVRGVLVFTVIQYGLQLLAVDPMWQQVMKGVIIAAAGIVEFLRDR